MNTDTNESRTEPGSLPRRLAALVYDLMLLAAILFFFTLAIFIVRGGQSVEPGTLWFQAALAAVIVGFFTWFWVHGGQTLGMRAWQIRLVDRSGRPIGWRPALIRFAAGIVAALPAGLGFWWGAFDRERRGWHDRLSGTKVIRERRVKKGAGTNADEKT